MCAMYVGDERIQSHAQSKKPHMQEHMWRHGPARAYTQDMRRYEQNKLDGGLGESHVKMTRLDDVHWRSVSLEAGDQSHTRGDDSIGTAVSSEARSTDTGPIRGANAVVEASGGLTGGARAPGPGRAAVEAASGENALLGSNAREATVHLPRRSHRRQKHSGRNGNRLRGTIVSTSPLLTSRARNLH